MRLLKRFLRSEWALYFLLVPTFYITTLLLNFFADIRLRHSIELAEREGIILDYKHYIPPEIPPEENASLKMEEMERYDVDGETRTLSFEDENIKIIKEIFDEMGKTPSGIPDRITELQKALQPLKPVVDAIEKYIHLENARFDTDYSYPIAYGEKTPDSESRASLGYVLQARAVVFMNDGNAGLAYENAKHILRLAKWCYQEFPSVLGGIISVKIIDMYCDTVHQLMTVQPPSSEIVHTIEQEMAYLIDNDLAEKSLFMELIETHFHYEITSGYQEIEAVRDVNFLFYPLAQGFVKACHSAHLDAYSQIILKLFDYPLWEIIGYVDGEFIKESYLPKWAVLPKIMIPTYVSFIGRYHAVMTSFHHSRLAFALDEFKSINGFYPDSIDELASLVPSELLIDPFSGENYIYSKENDGYVLYSVGYDQIDDGGKMAFYDNNAHNYKEGDYAWRMP